MASIELNNYTEGIIGQYNLSANYLNAYKNEYITLIGTNSDGKKCGLFVLKNPIIFDGIGALQPSTVYSQNGTLYFNNLLEQYDPTVNAPYKYKFIVNPAFSFYQLIDRSYITASELSNILGLPSSTTYNNPDNTGISFLKAQSYYIGGYYSLGYSCNLRNELGITDAMIGLNSTTQDIFNDLRVFSSTNGTTTGYTVLNSLGNQTNFWFRYADTSVSKVVNLYAKPLVMANYPANTLKVILTKPFVQYAFVDMYRLKANYILTIGVSGI